MENERWILSDELRESIRESSPRDWPVRLAPRFINNIVRSMISSTLVLYINMCTYIYVCILSRILFFNHFPGAGLSGAVTSFFVSIYYNVIIAYTVYYFFSAIQDRPPWEHCNNRWNTHSCWSAAAALTSNGTRPLNSKSPAEEFYKYLRALHILTSIRFTSRPPVPLVRPPVPTYRPVTNKTLGVSPWPTDVGVSGAEISHPSRTAAAQWTARGKQMNHWRSCRHSVCFRTGSWLVRSGGIPHANASQ